MTTTSHSQTALTAAASRAAHLIVDHDPHIFADTLASGLLGDRADELIAYHRLHGDHLVLFGARTQVIVRSRYAEAALAEARARGVGQYVILGAGLDSYAYRVEPAPTGPGAIRVFEVDHPASQAFKRERLAALAALATTGGATSSGAGNISPTSSGDTSTLATPKAVYVPVDFERDPLMPALLSGGFDPAAPAVVSWLGVCMYLTPDAIEATLRPLASLPEGSEVIFDYLLAEELRDADGRAYAEAVSAHSAASGEPWRSAFRPEEMSALLERCGFSSSRQVTQREAIPAALWDRTDSIRPSALSMIAHARI